MVTPPPQHRSRFEGLSFWFDSLPEPVVPRPPLDGDLGADVAILGAGFTGLWTAHYLLERQPSLRVAVVEAEVAGFGASGRNGGWCSALFAASFGKLARTVGTAEMHRLRRAMQDTVDEVGRRSAELGIDCHYRKAGTLELARSEAQEVRLRKELEAMRRLGVEEEDLRFLDAKECSSLLEVTDVRCGLFTPHCASLHPARLARGLARAVEAQGARLFEQTRATAVLPGDKGRSSKPRIRTWRGDVSADSVIVATEGYTSLLDGRHRDVVPLYSLMIATEPLADAVLDKVGGGSGVTFTDGRHLLVYGQRTADGRFAFGGRGAPYHFGSRILPEFDRVPSVHDALQRTLVELFPDVGGAAVTHRWGGCLGVHRDWHPSVAYDRATGLGIAGGYAGDGVATTNLAGRTLADLVLGERSDITTLCWVGHRSPRWEPEPLRFAGVNAGLVAMSAADRAEARSGRPSRLASAFGRLTGG